MNPEFSQALHGGLVPLQQGSSCFGCFARSTNESALPPAEQCSPDQKSSNILTSRKSCESAAWQVSKNLQWQAHLPTTWNWCIPGKDNRHWPRYAMIDQCSSSIIETSYFVLQDPFSNKNLGSIASTKFIYFLVFGTRSL